jgi:hypothetical protein
MAVVLRRFPALLLIVALALRGLVPAGFMLAPAADGTFSVVVCTVHGPVVVDVDRDGQPVKPGPGSAGALCVFAASAPAVAALALPELPRPALAGIADRQKPLRETLVSRSIRALPPARGPPVAV